jgi:hypothetical protein
MIVDTIIGIAMIIFGFYAIYSTYKNPNKTFWSSDFKGYGAGAGFIIIGIIYLLRKLHIVNW